jgi:hypothetical protein
VSGKNGEGRIAAEQQHFLLQMLAPLQELYTAAVGRQQGVSDC